MERASGVLMPVSSLPGPYGIGGFGWNAYDFVDFLASCKQHYWQILPLTTTSYGDSPYQSFSARAGNPNFIDFAELIEAGYLEQRDIDGVYLGSDPSNVDYGAIFGGRRQILDRAAERLAADKPADFDDFIQANEDWLIPYCEFMTVKEECGLKAFWEWPAELRTRGEASAKVCADHPARMLYHQMTQYFFDRQWSRLKAYANERDILIIGDLPIYVSRDSVEMWATPELFKIDAAGNPVSVAGTTPASMRSASHGQRRAVQPSFFTYSVQSWQLTSLGVYLNVLIYMASSFWHENSGQTNCLSAQRLWSRWRFFCHASSNLKMVFSIWNGV